MCGDYTRSSRSIRGDYRQVSDTIGPWENITEASPQLVIEPIRTNPDADKQVEVDLNLTLITGTSYKFTTKFTVYTYNAPASAKHVHYKISCLPYLTSSDSKTMFKMNNVVSVEVLNIKELYENR